MRTRRGKATPSLRKKERALGNVTNPKVMLDLAVELYQVASDLQTALGQSREQQSQAAELARRKRKRRRPSEEVRKAVVGVSELLHMWRKHVDYQNPDGTPRVLPIRGKGPSIEKLAHQHLPRIPLKEAFAMIREQSEVLPCENDKVALSGSSLVLTKTTPEATFAWTITQIRHVAETILYNTALPVSDPHRSRGRPERRISAVVPEEKFEEFVRWIRPKISKLSDEIEYFLHPDASDTETGRGKRSGVIIAVYRDDGSLG